MAFQPVGSWWSKGLVKALKMELTKANFISVSFRFMRCPAVVIETLKIPVTFSAPNLFSCNHQFWCLHSIPLVFWH